MALALTRSDLGRERGLPELAARLERAIAGEVRFSAFDRGRYSTDASIYQVEPVGVVLPRSDADVQAALALAREAGVPVVARGGGTSQAGQTIGSGLVIDYSKYLDRVLELDAESRTVWVEPGVVLDRLNRFLKAAGAVLPGRHLDRLARDNWRHGRQQRLRRALDPLRHHGRQPARDRRAAAGRRAGPLRRGPGQPPGRAREPALSRPDPGDAGPGRTRGRSDRRGLPQGPAPGRRLQPRPGAAGRPQHGGAPGRLGRHARAVPPAQAQAAAAAAAQGPGRLPLPELPSGDGLGSGDRRPRAVRGRAGRPHDHRARAQDPRLPAADRPFRARHARRAAAGRVRGRGAGEPARGPRAPRGADGGARPAGRRGRGDRARGAGADLGRAQGRAQHRDVDEGRGQAGLVHRGLRRAARASRRLHRAPDRDLRPPRHQRHLVRARLGRLPARAPDPQPQAGSGRARDAPDRRGGDGPRPRLQGRALRRARRRPGALGVPRGDVRAAPRPRLRAGQGRVRSRGRAQPGQDRARPADGRAPPPALPAGLPGDHGRDRPRLAGLGRFPRRRRDVQQQRRLPQGRARGDVPVLSRDEGRDPPHPRPRQQPPPRALRPARAGRATLRRDGGDARPLRVLQGLPARMSDRRRHGADEDRGPAPAPEAPRPRAQGPR